MNENIGRRKFPYVFLIRSSLFGSIIFVGAFTQFEYKEGKESLVFIYLNRRETSNRKVICAL